MIRVAKEVADEEGGQEDRPSQMVPRNAVANRGGTGSARKGKREDREEAPGPGQDQEEDARRVHQGAAEKPVTRKVATAVAGPSSTRASGAGADPAAGGHRRQAEDDCGLLKPVAAAGRAAAPHFKKLTRGAQRVRFTPRAESPDGHAQQADGGGEAIAAGGGGGAAEPAAPVRARAAEAVPPTRVLRSHRKEAALTVPKSPRFTKRSRFNRGAVMSTEDREMLEAAAAREDAAKRRRLNSANVHRNHRAGGRAYPTRARVAAAGAVAPSGPVTRSQTRGAGPPKLATSQRASMYKYTRPKPLSTEEREAMAIAARPKFKARAVGAPVLRSRGDHGVPKVAKRKATEAVGPQLSTETRLKVRRTGGGGPGAGARSAPAAAPGRAAAAASVTLPMSPKFETKYRTRSRAAASGGAAPRLGARPAAARPKAGASAGAAAGPFELRTEARGTVYRAQFDRDLKKTRDRERQQRIPRAALVPRTNTCPAIPKKPPAKPATVAKPFNLESMTLHTNALAQWERDVQRQEREDASLRSFTARENPMFTQQQAPPAPAPAARNWQPTRPVEFNFRVDSRAPERSRFNAAVQTRQELARREREAEEERKMEAEHEEVARMRKSLVFRARPAAESASARGGAQSRLRSGAVRVAPVFQTRTTRSMVRSMR